jgi:hypothetical protein
MTEQDIRRQAGLAPNRQAREWEREPDHDHFMAHGLHCVMNRAHFSGAWCGYVGIGAAHPLYGISFDDVVPWDSKWMERAVDIDEIGALNLFVMAYELQTGQIPDGHAPLTSVLACHGRLTFSGPRREWTGWWFGFDCAHAGDYQPEMVRMMLTHGFDADLLHGSDVYRNQAYARHECENLAWQLAQYAAACQLTPSLSKE